MSSAGLFPRVLKKIRNILYVQLQFLHFILNNYTEKALTASGTAMNSSDNYIVTDSIIILEKHAILVNLHKYISNPHPIMIFFCIILICIAAMASTTMQLEKVCFPPVILTVGYT